MRTATAGLTLLLAGAAGLAAPADDPRLLEAGKKTYAKYCSQCHGDKGDGEGPAAAHLLPRPRDFTTGKFKLRTTPSGALPTDDDLRRVIRQGMPYTTMPPWPGLGDEEVSGLVAYVKSFHSGFAETAEAPKPIDLPAAPASSRESVEKGQQLYSTLGCVRCHGEKGRGDGPSAPTLRDDKGDPIRAADLTQRWTFRGGPRREDIFRTFSTGLNGTPMPSFYDSLKPEERWALTDFVYSLGDGDAPGYTSVIVATPADEEPDLARGEQSFTSSPAARLALVGQVMQPGRAFAPAASSIQVRAVYGPQAIAFLVTWHDVRQDASGRNDPAAEVPLAEEDALVPAPPAEKGGGGFWGEEEAPAAAGAKAQAGGGAAAASAAGKAPAAAGEGGDFWGETEGAPATAAPASEFSDAVAIQLPQQLSVGNARPYFLFGDGQLGVDVWFLDVARRGVRQLVGHGSGALAPLESSEVDGAARYAAGEWSAVFVRPLRSTGGVSFAEGSYVPVAFSVWDGTARERGNKRALTQWAYVYLQPREKPSALGPMAAAALSVLALELLVVGAIRRRARARAAAAPSAGA